MKNNVHINIKPIPRHTSLTLQYSGEEGNRGAVWSEVLPVNGITCINFPEFSVKAVNKSHVI